MSDLVDFGSAASASITVLVDNRADLVVESTDTVKRFTDRPLLAEHGFSALIDLNDGETRILWDAGITEIALLENMQRMGIGPETIDKIALSHGHGDHTAAVTKVLRAIDPLPDPRTWEEPVTAESVQAWLDGYRIPLVAHPAAFRERWGLDQEGNLWGPIYPPPRRAWESAGARIVLSEGPYRLGPGCWTTGMVPRKTFEHSGIPKRLKYREGDDIHPDYIEEDQAIAIHVEGKGLVVLSGCAHSGIVNTVRRAQSISGVERVWAVLGGFHLARSTDEEIQRTIDEIRALHPVLVVPSHCTGFVAIRQFAVQMPESFVLGLVGTTYLF